MKRLKLLLLLPVLLLSTFITSAVTTAQGDTVPATDATRWIPADFSAFVRVDMQNPQNALLTLNVTSFIAANVQPGRATAQTVQSFDPYFPLTSLDLENASFTQSLLPIVDGEAILAYRTLDAAFMADAEDTLLILPTDDALQATAALAPLISGQDLLRRETYRDVTLHIGDQTAFAIAPTAVLIGGDDLLRAALDTFAGEAPGLIEAEAYQAVSAQLAASGAIFGYFDDAAARAALGVLLSGDDRADPLLSALGEALASAEDTSLFTHILNGAVDGIGVRVAVDVRLLESVDVQVVAHLAETVETETAFDASVLDLIPRSAMLVQSGADARSSARAALYALPLSNFAGRVLRAFPVGESAASASGALDAPSAADLEAAVTGFARVIEPILDLEAGLFDQLDGSYVVALLPRPNDPLPTLNTRYDVLLIAQTPDAESAAAVQAGIAALLETFGAPLDADEAGTFLTLPQPDTGDPLLRVGVVDNLVVIGTGEATAMALRAQAGDNRLIAQERWQNLTADGIPYTYFDVVALLNTFFPAQGGAVAQDVAQIGITSSQPAPDLVMLRLRVTLNV